MDKALDDLLCSRYPALFSQRQASPQETSMCWGFACGNGWFSLVDSFCAEVERLIQFDGLPPVVISQVKSKLGTLRIHYRGGDDRVRVMAGLIQTLSASIDEDSGAPKPPSP